MDRRLLLMIVAVAAGGGAVASAVAATSISAALLVREADLERWRLLKLLLFDTASRLTALPLLLRPLLFMLTSSELRILLPCRPFFDNLSALFRPQPLLAISLSLFSSFNFIIPSTPKSSSNTVCSFKVVESGKEE